MADRTTERAPFRTVEELEADTRAPVAGCVESQPQQPDLGLPSAAWSQATWFLRYVP